MWLLLRYVDTLHTCDMSIITNIKFIDRFFTCLDRYFIQFYLNYCREYVIGCFTIGNCVYYCDLFPPIQWLILYLLKSSWVSFSFELLWCVCFCIFAKGSLSYIQFINWFFTCFNFHVVSFYLIHCSWYIRGCFLRAVLSYMFVK